MSKSKESGIRKNIGNFEHLIAAIRTYESYAPTNASLEIAQMEELMFKAEKVVEKTAVV